MATHGQLHHEAMQYAERATVAETLGDDRHAQTLFRKALEKEVAAAEQFHLQPTMEPDRAILYRSAANLAYRCHEFRQAEQLAATALAGNPPEPIAEELRTVLEQVALQRQFDALETELTDGHESEQIVGELRFADSLGRKDKGVIGLIDDQGNRLNIVVPQGLSSIVAGLWSQKVIVTATRAGRTVYMQQIDRVTV